MKLRPLLQGCATSQLTRIAAAQGLHPEAGTLRRELVNHQLLTRKSDCSAYRKLPARPEAEARALMTAWRALVPKRGVRFTQAPLA